MIQELFNDLKTFRPINRKWHWAILLVSISSMVLLACVDYLDGPEVHISAMYMIPIFFCTWFIGFGAGALLSLLGSLTLLIDPVFYPQFHSTIGVVFLNIGSLMVVNTVFSLALVMLKKNISELHDQLKRDELTGLLNTAAFFELAEQERLRSIRYGHPLTICFLDLDNFKNINDTLGHLAGSELLRMTAGILRNGVRATDQVARLGGDEFIMLFPETGQGAVDALITKIQHDLCDGFREKACDTTPSIGLATFYQMPPRVDDLVHQADQLMYSSKKAGKNKITAKVVDPVDRRAFGPTEPRAND